MAGSPINADLWLSDYLTPWDLYAHGITRILTYKQTPYQQMYVVETNTYGKALVLDGKLQSTTGDEFLYHEPLVHPAMIYHREPRTVLILGGGATARAAIAAFDSVGASIDVASRSEHRSASLIKSALFAPVSVIGFDDQINWSKYDLIINTSPAGAADELVGKIAGASALLFEALYNPWPTALMGFWRNVGLESIDGLDLLVHQAISQVAIFAGTSVKRSQLAPLMREAALKRL